MKKQTEINLAKISKQLKKIKQPNLSIMKKIFFASSFILLLNFFSVAVFAQSAEETIETTANPTPKFLSEKGYWQVESNIDKPKVNTIYFYNNNNVMVYKENLNGVEINLKKRRVKKALKKVLEQSILAYNPKLVSTENKMLVVNLIKR
jgi:hypothetical protein